VHTFVLSQDFHVTSTNGNTAGKSKRGIKGSKSSPNYNKCCKSRLQLLNTALELNFNK